MFHFSDVSLFSILGCFQWNSTLFLGCPISEMLLIFVSFLVAQVALVCPAPILAGSLHQFWLVLCRRMMGQVLFRHAILRSRRERIPCLSYNLWESSYLVTFSLQRWAFALQLGAPLVVEPWFWGFPLIPYPWPRSVWIWLIGIYKYLECLVFLCACWRLGYL